MYKKLLKVSLIVGFAIGASFLQDCQAQDYLCIPYTLATSATKNPKPSTVVVSIMKKWCTDKGIGDYLEYNQNLCPETGWLCKTPAKEELPDIGL